MPRNRLQTAKEVCEEYLSRGLTGHVAADHTRIAEVRRFIDQCGSILVDDLIADDLERWIESRPQLKSPWSKKRVAQTIKRAFSFAWKKGLIGTHPFIGVSYRAGGRGKPMTGEQYRMILRDLPAHVRRALMMLWESGCRPKELCTMLWTDVNAANGTVELKEHKTAHTSFRPRVIFLSQKMMRLFAWMALDQPPETEHIFLNAHRRRWHRPDLSRIIHRACARQGFPGVLAYGCRHNFVTRMLLAGVELKTASILAGHSSVRTTETYCHLESQTAHLHSALEQGLAAKNPKEAS